MTANDDDDDDYDQEQTNGRMDGCTDTSNFLRKFTAIWAALVGQMASSKVTA